MPCVRCWVRPWAALTEKPFQGALDPRLLAAVLLAVMAACYTLFARGGRRPPP